LATDAGLKDLKNINTLELNNNTKITDKGLKYSYIRIK